jgi:signal transduction histidine kinase/ActR/RegA family two-component response regulator
MNSPSKPFGRRASDGGAVDMHWAFEQSPDCIKIMGCTGNLLAMNVNGQCAMEIDDFQSVAGKLWPQLWPAPTQATVKASLASAMAGEASHFDAFCPTAKGTPKWWDVLVTPIRGNDGAVTTVLAVSRDITAVHMAVEQRLQLAARLEFTMQAAGFGEWRLDLVTGHISCTPRFDQCFGHDAGTLAWTMETMLGHVHRDDQAMVATALAVSHVQAPLRFECRVVWPDASVHWISAQASHFAVPGEHDHMIGLVSDITERMQTTEALQDASRKKDEFLAMLAHELRNPLAPISAAAQVITGGRADAALVAKAGAIIERQSRHMSHLLDDLLDVARVTQGLVALDMTQLDLGRVAADAIEQARPMIAQLGHALDIAIDPAPMCVLGDDERLVQVLANLLNNAAKYTPPGGRLALSIAADGAHARISVRDNGIGMAPSTLAQAFDLFSQAARSSDRSTGGLGLGLALVKGLVERHGGTVAGYSDGPNCGSEFVVHLPLVMAAPGVAGVAASSASPPAPGALRLLIVDDNVDAAETLAMYLGMLGHDTHVAFSARDGLAQTAQLPFDACLLDVGLPDMSGHELARRMTALHTACCPVLIAITGYGSASDREESASAGFHHHLTKPVDTNALEAVLTTIRAAGALEA